MLKTAIWAMFAGLLSACSGAQAKTYDSSDPVHCLTIFSLASVGAASDGNSVLSDAMKSKMVSIVEQNGGAKWLEKASPEAQRLGVSFEAEKNEAALGKLLRECQAR